MKLWGLNFDTAKPQFNYLLIQLLFTETKQSTQVKTPKPEKGRYQHREPPYYRTQLTNLTTKPKKLAKQKCTNNTTFSLPLKLKITRRLNSTSVKHPNLHFSAVAHGQHNSTLATHSIICNLPREIILDFCESILCGL